MTEVGMGSAAAHHGEILQGMFPGPHGAPMRGLVTLPCPVYSSSATFRLDSEGKLTVEPAWKWKALKAAGLTLEHLGFKGMGGLLTITSTIPPKLGMGSSTSDVVATIRAVAQAVEAAMTSLEEARLAISAETASDSTMFGDQAILFAQRDALVLEDFGEPLPPMEVLSFDTGNAVDTLDFPPAEYGHKDLKEFEELLALLRQGIQEQSPKLVAEVASASARINQRHLPKAHFGLFERIAGEAGALGLQVAHSGSVIGLLFAPDDLALEEYVGYAGRMLTEAGFTRIRRFKNWMTT